MQISPLNRRALDRTDDVGNPPLTPSWLRAVKPHFYGHADEVAGPQALGTREGARAATFRMGPQAPSSELGTG